MSHQSRSLFDDEVPSVQGLERGRARKHEGQERATRHTDLQFREAAEAAYKWVARVYREFTSDHVWKRLDAQGYEGNVPHRANFVGRMMSHLAGMGWARDSGRVVQTARAKGKARKITVWISRRYEGGPDRVQ